MNPIVTPSFNLLTLPDLRIKKEDANSPYLHIVVNFSKY